MAILLYCLLANEDVFFFSLFHQFLYFKTHFHSFRRKMMGICKPTHRKSCYYKWAPTLDVKDLSSVWRPPYQIEAWLGTSSTHAAPTQIQPISTLFKYAKRSHLPPVQTFRCGVLYQMENKYINYASNHSYNTNGISVFMYQLLLFVRNSDSECLWFQY